MTSRPADRLRKCYAVLIIAGVIGAQFWMIWQQTWTLGAGGLEDRAGVRELEREWLLACERGAAVSQCASEIP